MAEVEITAPGRPYEVVSQTGALVVAAFPTAPWTALRADPQAPQARRLPRSLKAKVMYDLLYWTRREEGDR